MAPISIQNKGLGTKAPKVHIPRNALRSQTRDKTRARYTCYIAQSRSECQIPSLNGAPGMTGRRVGGGGPGWGWSGRLRAISALRSQPCFNARLSLALILSIFPKNLNHVTRWSSENISKQFGYILVFWSSTITPVWGCDHLLDAKSNVWSTQVIHPGSWAACSEVHHSEKTELFQKPWSALEFSCKEFEQKLCSALSQSSCHCLCLLPSFSPLWRRISSCCSRDTFLLMGRNPNLSWKKQLKANSILGYGIASPVSTIDTVPWNLKSVSLENVQLSQTMAKLQSMAMLPIFRI